MWMSRSWLERVRRSSVTWPWPLATWTACRACSPATVRCRRWRASAGGFALPRAGARGRLRRSDCGEEGIVRIGAGRGFSYRDADGERVEDEETLERIRELAIPPAWKEVWICPDPLRAHPGDRHRRSRAQAVPLPRALAAAPGGAQVRAGARVRRHAAAAAPRRHRRPAPPGDAARAGAGLRRPPPRPRLLPGRQRGLRGGKRELRPGHRAPRARHGQATARSSSTSPPRAASAGCSRSATRPARRAIEAMHRRRSGPEDLLA